LNFEENQSAASPAATTPADATEEAVTANTGLDVGTNQNPTQKLPHT